MDVRISYGIALDKVPDKIMQLLSKFDATEISDLVYFARQLLETSNVEMSDALLEQARLKLTALDRLLNDSQMILKGYIDAKNPENKEVGGVDNVD